MNEDTNKMTDEIEISSLLSGLTLNETDKVDQWLQRHDINRKRLILKEFFYLNEEYITESMAKKFMNKHLEDVQKLATFHADRSFASGISKNVELMLKKLHQLDQDNIFITYRFGKKKRPYYKLSELIIFFVNHLRNMDQALSS